jgi:hypothetical protein
MHAFSSDEATEIFWDRFTHYCAKYNFVPWVVTLLVNHYHILGYLKKGENLGPFMQHVHGSVAKLVNDVLPERHLPFWRSAGNKDYFDGCLRDVLQLRRAFNYTKLQAVRARIVKDYRLYPHTRIYVPLEQTIEFAVAHDSFLEDLPYARYERNRARKPRGR